MKRNSLSISSMFVVLAFASALIPHQVHAADTPATIISPPNSSVLSGASQTFTWTDAGASLYQIWAGTSQGAHNIGSYPPAGTTDTSTIVNGLPINGSTIYVRLRSKFGSAWYFKDYIYTSTQPISGTVAVTSLPTPVSIQLPLSTNVTQTAGNYINAGSPSMTTSIMYSYDRCRVGSAMITHKAPRLMSKFTIPYLNISSIHSLSQDQVSTRPLLNCRGVESRSILMPLFLFTL